MTTITNVADLAQYTLADSAGATWPQATVEEWVKEALRDYGAHFSRTRTTTIACVAGQHSYDLPDDLEAALLVEYPRGQDPPEYLRLRSRKDPDWWAADDYYDLEHSRQGSNEEPVLWISAEATAGQTIGLTYSAAYYDVTASPADANVYVPDPHIPILVQFVAWKAGLERLNDELQHPDRTVRMIAPMQEAAAQQRSTYLEMIARAVEAAGQSRVTLPWRADLYEPIY